MRQSRRRKTSLHCETLSSLSDLRRTRHFHGLKRRVKEANLDFRFSNGKLFGQLLSGVPEPVGPTTPLPPIPPGVVPLL